MSDLDEVLDIADVTDIVIEEFSKAVVASTFTGELKVLEVKRRVRERIRKLETGTKDDDC